MSSDIHYPGFPQIPYACNFSDINMSSSETLTAQDCWLDTFFFSPFYNSWRQVWFWIMMSGIIPINIGQWIRRFKGKNRKARRSFENDILAHSQIKTISRHSESRRSQKQWKGIVFFFKSAQNDIICSLFTDERHSGCGCTVENKSDAQFLKSWQIHNIYFLSLLETFFEIVASGKLTQIVVENHCEYVEFTKLWQRLPINSRGSDFLCQQGWRIEYGVFVH